MIPQSSFMIVAAIDPRRESELRQILAAMNDGPGQVRPDNAVIPFARFDTLHMARLLVLDDRTTGDGEVYGLPRPTYPSYLAFLGDVDGEADAFLHAVAAAAPAGLRTLFSCCQDVTGTTNLYEWMKAHSVTSAADYVNWRGRTVARVREEEALRNALERHVQSLGAAIDRLPPAEIHATLRQLAQADIAAGRLTLSAEAPTPLGWRLRNALNLVGLPLLLLLPIVLLVLLPAGARRIALLLLAAAVAIAVVRLRRLEKTDPELCSRTEPAHAAALAAIEDHTVSNQFSAMGSVKPGLLRLWTARLVLAAIDYAARHVYTRGRLARVRTIHFARWVFLDGRRRIVFFSNYDGSLESYMDDFINKVGFGLNVVFSNGIGYPRTKWLLFDGCADERKFKEFLRRHQMPTDVWYKAYPGLTAIELERNGRIRQGFERTEMSAADARAWVALL